MSRSEATFNVEEATRFEPGMPIATVNLVPNIRIRDMTGLVVRVPGYTTEMYCVSCEVRTEFIYVM
jgi:hypothetical protein